MSQSVAIVDSLFWIHQGIYPCFLSLVSKGDIGTACLNTLELSIPFIFFKKIKAAKADK